MVLDLGACKYITGNASILTNVIGKIHKRIMKT